MLRIALHSVCVCVWYIRVLIFFSMAAEQSTVYVVPSCHSYITRKGKKKEEAKVGTGGGPATIGPHIHIELSSENRRGTTFLKIRRLDV